MSDTPVVLAPGSVFQGRYEIVRCIKAGGMGAVYEVIHLETRRRRAMKVMLPSVVGDPDLRARFKLEATVTADIDSEHIVETFDAGVDAETGQPFLVMELLKGEDLATTLERQRRLSPQDVVKLLHQAALALDRTHAAGVVHRDLKPENLFVTRRDDGSPRLKILDFGIAKLVAQSGQAKATRTMGTPLYMSPEQLQGDGRIGPRSDLYALAHIAFTLLVGEAYWEPETRTPDGIYPLLVRVLEGAKDPATTRARNRGVALPETFDRWFATATALHAEHRFGSGRELVHAFAQAFGLAPPIPVVADSGNDDDETQLQSHRAPLARESSAPTFRATQPAATPVIGRTVFATPDGPVAAPATKTTLAVSSDREPGRRSGGTKRAISIAAAAVGLGGLALASVVTVFRAGTPADPEMRSPSSVVAEPQPSAAPSPMPPPTGRPSEEAPPETGTSSADATPAPSGDPAVDVAAAAPPPRSGAAPALAPRASSQRPTSTAPKQAPGAAQKPRSDPTRVR